MKHATDVALERLEPLIAKIRDIPGVVEKKRGIFYRAGRALVHFHEDGVDLFADIKVDNEWVRQRVSTKVEQATLLRSLKSKEMTKAS
jgi:hypothetical protein